MIFFSLFLETPSIACIKQRAINSCNSKHIRFGCVGNGKYVHENQLPPTVSATMIAMCCFTQMSQREYMIVKILVAYSSKYKNISYEALREYLRKEKVRAKSYGPQSH